jgi:hypothetical protein
MDMLTVDDINRTFADKGVHIKLPLPGHYAVKNMQILERKRVPGGVGLLLNIRFVNDRGEDVSDLFYCEGELEHEEKKEAETEESQHLPLTRLLPLRSKEGFDSEGEALDYLKQAITHLLEDKGYSSLSRGDSDLYFENEGVGFFVNLAIRCDDQALQKAEDLIRLRHEQGVDHDYGVLVPAFQETLGVSLLNEERWILRNQERLTINRIGLYAVDNWNPNLIYAFSIHPGPRELKRFFMTTGPKWTLVRSRYVLGRKKRAAEGRGSDTGEADTQRGM